MSGNCINYDRYEFLASYCFIFVVWSSTWCFFLKTLRALEAEPAHLSVHCFLQLFLQESEKKKEVSPMWEYDWSSSLKVLTPFALVWRKGRIASKMASLPWATAMLSQKKIYLFVLQQEYFGHEWLKIVGWPAASMDLSRRVHGKFIWFLWWDNCLVNKIDLVDWCIWTF